MESRARKGVRPYSVPASVLAYRSAGSSREAINRSPTASPISSATIVLAIENEVRRIVSLRPYW